MSISMKKMQLLDLCKELNIYKDELKKYTKKELIEIIKNNNSKAEAE